jgi:serine protease inhibitor
MVTIPPVLTFFSWNSNNREGTMRIGTILTTMVVVVSGLAPRAAAITHAQSTSSCLPSVPQPMGAYGGLVKANNSFGFRLFRQSGIGNRQNLFLSPTSAALALEMTYGGAQGTTRQAISTALGLGAMSQAAVRQQAASLLASLRSADPRVKLRVANALWARAGVRFHPAFLRDTSTYYGARATVADFKAPSTVTRLNSWVTCATSGTIKSIVDHIPPDVILYLLNTVYFHGDWTSPFENAFTTPGSFTTGTGATVQVPFMHQTHAFAYAARDGMQLVSLPYGLGRFKVSIVLPNSGVTLGSLAAKLSNATWKSWTNAQAGREVDLRLPRFTASTSLSLKPMLAGMGMAQAFSDRANFNGMCTSGCTISDVIHKTMVRMDERGTTAAAVTSVSVSPTAIQAGPGPVRVTVDHPFLLAITDSKTGSVLFFGGINNPKAG